MRDIMSLPSGVDEFYRNMSPFYRDQLVTYDDVKFDYRVKTSDEANSLIDKIPNGEYLSIPNLNNLNEAHIYRKINFDEDVKTEDIWGGVKSDKSWYKPEESIYYISDGNQLKGFQELESDGVTFEGKEVQLVNNIDLGFQEWEPIGAVYKINSEKSSDSSYSKYDINIDSNHVFKGTFNGAGHIIYGLTISERKDDGNFYGFFLALKEAIVKNIVFADVCMSSKDYRKSYAAIAGVAENCIFSNIHVSGKITCAKPSGLCGIAIDSVFYNCKNSTRLIAESDTMTGIIVGGICQQVSLSKKMINHLKGNVPKIFVKCVNEGTIIADGKNAKYLWAGHFFGGTFYKRNVMGFSFMMEKCKIHSEAHIYACNTADIEGECVFFGYRDGAMSESNNIGPTTKEDLLSGLIGRVDRYVDITVMKTTMSTVVNNMVIPGTVNTLHSDTGENIFFTVDASPVVSEDCVYDLEPFFKYIKTVKI